MSLIVNVGILEAAPFPFNEVIGNVSLSEGGSLARYRLTLVLEDDNLEPVYCK